MATGKSDSELRRIVKKSKASSEKKKMCMIGIELLYLDENDLNYMLSEDCTEMQAENHLIAKRKAAA